MRRNRTGFGRRLGEATLEALDLEDDGEVDVAGEEEAELVSAHRDRARVRVLESMRIWEERESGDGEEERREKFRTVGG